MRTDLFLLAALGAWPIVAYLGWRGGFSTGRRHEQLMAEHRAKVLDRRRRERGGS